MGYFVTRGKIDQETLEHLTGFSRSTISRSIQQLIEDGRISANKREFRKSRDYFLKSISMCIINYILKADYLIFSWTPKFKVILQELQTKKEYQKNKEDNHFLHERITGILKEIEEFKQGSKLLENARNELRDFINH